MNKAMKPHWYFFTYEECPVCGRGKSYRERRYTPRPSDGSLRYDFKQTYDYCLEREAIAYA